jgi:hypothetical protein
VRVPILRLPLLLLSLLLLFSLFLLLQLSGRLCEVRAQQPALALAPRHNRTRHGRRLGWVAPPLGRCCLLVSWAGSRR